MDNKCNNNKGQNDIHTSKDGCNKNYECDDGSDNYTSVSSAKQQHKSALTSYVNQIVVPTTNTNC